MPYFLQFRSYKLDSETGEPSLWRHGPYDVTREEIVDRALAMKERMGEFATVSITEVGDCTEFDDN